MAITLLDSLEPTNRYYSNALSTKPSNFLFSMEMSVFVTKVIKIQQIMNTASLLSTASQQLRSVPLTQCMMVYVSTASPLRSDLKFRHCEEDTSYHRQRRCNGWRATRRPIRYRRYNAVQCDCDGLSNDFPCWGVCGQVVETSSSSPANRRHTPLCPRLFISPGVRGVDNTPHKLPMATRDIYETGFDEDVQTNSSTNPCPGVMAGHYQRDRNDL